MATDEKLYEEETGVKNLHSYNTATGEDTLLAYNVADVVFDSEDKTNARVYYTMSVYDYSQTSNTAYGYNQLYTTNLYSYAAEGKETYAFLSVSVPSSLVLFISR